MTSFMQDNDVESVISFYLYMYFGTDSGRQAWMACILAVEPSCWPLSWFSKVYTMEHLKF